MKIIRHKGCGKCEFIQESIETMDYTKLKMMQNELFCNLFRRVYNSVDYYKVKIDKAGINRKEIRSLDDINRRPFMTKDDVRRAYPDKLLAVPRSKSVRIQSTSCTPSYAAKLGEYIVKNDLRGKLSLSSGIFGAEPWTDKKLPFLKVQLRILQE